MSFLLTLTYLMCTIVLNTQQLKTPRKTKKVVRYILKVIYRTRQSKIQNFNKNTIYLLISYNTKKRLVQNIYLHYQITMQVK